MKRFVRLPKILQGALLVLGGFFLVAIVEQETVTSYLVLAGVTALLIRGEWLSYQQEKDEKASRRA